MIDLYSAPTPNGHKVSIALEEMALPYTLHPINLSALEQKKPEFLHMNPNGRIPVIVDREAQNLTVFESGAILMYLAEKTGTFFPTDRVGRTRVIEWLMFQMSAIGPTMGQANAFGRYMEEKIPSAIARFRNEGRRLFEVLNTQLAENEYIAGTDYTIADMNLFPHINIRDWSGISWDNLPHLQRWFNQVQKRPAVIKGLTVPPVAQLSEAERIAAARTMITK